LPDQILRKCVGIQHGTVIERGGEFLDHDGSFGALDEQSRMYFSAGHGTHLSRFSKPETAEQGFKDVSLHVSRILREFPDGWNPGNRVVLSPEDGI